MPRVVEKIEANSDRAREGNAFANARSTTNSVSAYTRSKTISDVESSRDGFKVSRMQDEDTMIANVLPAQVRAEIMSYQRPSNYYGDGSVATSGKDCKAAIDFLVLARLRNPAIQMPSSISPSVDGGIALYWKKGICRLLAEIADGNTTKIDYQYVSPDGVSSVGTDTREGLLTKLSLIYPR